MKYSVIGIDCATKPNKVGLALGSLVEDTLSIEAVELGSSRTPPVETVERWIRARGNPTLLALDAPLGWPASLGSALSSHEAGARLSTSPDALFHRSTDDHVRDSTGKVPFEVGANLIARTAHAALALLDDLRERLGQPIPLAWDPTVEGIAAIEVYPAATLRAYGITSTGYTKSDSLPLREDIVQSISPFIQHQLTITDLASIDHVLEAVICTLAARDFLLGSASAPLDIALAKKEGWIWVRPRLTAG